MGFIKQNLVLILVVLGVVLFFMWFALRSPVGEVPVLTAEGPGAGDTAQEEELLKLLVDMRSIRLDESIFQDPAFRSLRDFGREIIPEPIGRPNPFEPTSSVLDILPATGDQSVEFSDSLEFPTP